MALLQQIEAGRVDLDDPVIVLFAGAHDRRHTVWVMSPGRVICLSLAALANSERSEKGGNSEVSS